MVTFWEDDRFFVIWEVVFCWSEAMLTFWEDDKFDVGEVETFCEGDSFDFVENDFDDDMIGTFCEDDIRDTFWDLGGEGEEEADFEDLVDADFFLPLGGEGEFLDFEGDGPLMICIKSSLSRTSSRISLNLFCILERRLYSIFK